MSGGAYNYLYTADDWNADDLERMAERLADLGCHVAAARTRALIAPRLAHDAPLRSLWFEVEWRDSGDTGEDRLREAVEAWRKYDTYAEARLLLAAHRREHEA